MKLHGHRDLRHGLFLVTDDGPILLTRMSSGDLIAVRLEIETPAGQTGKPAGDSVGVTGRNRDPELA